MLTNRQKRDNVRKWIKALRSGEYKQTTGVLRRRYFDSTTASEGIGYCCLGVVCDIFKPEDAKWEPNTNGKFTLFDARYDVPQEIMDITGIEFAQFHAWNDGLGFVELNDNRGATFDEIADMLDLWLLDTAK